MALLQTITLPGQTIVKKNHMRIVKFGKFSSIRTGKAYDEYEKDCLKYVCLYHKPQKFEYPIYAHYYFYRKDKRKFDLTNLCEGPQDMLQKAMLIDDDSMDFLIPVFDSQYSGWEVCKSNPRCVVYITDEDY